MKRRVAYIVYAKRDDAHLLDGTIDIPAHTGTFVSIDFKYPIQEDYYIVCMTEERRKFLLEAVDGMP